MAKRLRSFGVSDPVNANAVFMRLADEAKKEKNWFPLRMNARRDAAGAIVHQANVVVRLAKASDGRPICTGLLIGGFDEREITARSLRELPLIQFLGRIGRCSAR